ncbi:hypothetical protein LCGC14_0506360 [marine sediment metagenome]|uniref:Uncharacterized protein n=1 Tax=marine sediment metagenome TaxID=412755 RepID=A0A0F9UP57_9ZZZZ
MNFYGKIIEKDVLHHKCKSCGRSLRINQVIRKEIDDKEEFIVSVYYCYICDLYILRFKTIEKKRDDPYNKN